MSTRKIIVRDPGLWDADCVECPFADQDNVCCLAYALGIGNVIYCDSDGNAESCPLNDGPVTVSMAEKEAGDAEKKHDCKRTSCVVYDRRGDEWGKERCEECPNNNPQESE